MPRPENLAAHEDSELLDKLVQMLKERCQPGERVIRCGPFRWRDEAGNFLGNHYEMFDLDQLASDFNYEIVWDFTHAAIIRDKAPEVAAA